MKIFLIAGEPSGDVIGEKLIKAFQRLDPSHEFFGLGGARMESAGLQSLIPMKEVTVMGIWEVLLRIPHLWKIIMGLIEEIEKTQPDIVVTIDFPDFNFYLAKTLKKRGNFKGHVVHYVAPTVWAWRPGRAKAISRFLDGLICLLPFEPPYFEKHGLASTFIGHPVTQENPLMGRGKRFREANEIPPDAKVLGLFFGSREEEYDVHGKVLQETAIYMSERFENLVLVVPTLPEFEFQAHDLTVDVPCPKYLVFDSEQRKWDAFAAMDAALAVSGTVGLELAYADIPHAIAYKTSWLNWVMIKLLVKVRYAHLANIIVDEPIVPEFLQHRCKSEKIADCLEDLLRDDANRKAQKAGFAKMRDLLGVDLVDLPSDRAVKFILEVAQGKAKVTAKPRKPEPSTDNKAPTSASLSERKDAPQGRYKADAAVQSAKTALQSFLSTAKSTLRSVRQRIKQ